MARKYVPGSFFQARKMRAPDQKWEGGIRMLQTVGIGKEFQTRSFGTGMNIAGVFFVQPYDGFRMESPCSHIERYRSVRRKKNYCII